VLRRAIAVSPGIGALRRRLAIVLEQEARFAEALAEADRAVAMDPSDASALHVRAIAFDGLGRLPQARADLERALELAARANPVEGPESAILRMRLARLLLKTGDLDGAGREIERAITADPASSEARRGNARVLLLRDEEAEAAVELEEALRLDVSSTPALCDLAWLRSKARDARVRDPREAVSLAEKAAGLTSSAPVLDVLAAAYASAGRLDDAARTAERAEASANAAGERELAGRIAKRLEAYRKGTVDAETPR
jgi:tetratricopeptide (TPR) repeat protein